MSLRVWRLPTHQADLMQPSKPAANHGPDQLKSGTIMSSVLQDLHDCLRRQSCNTLAAKASCLQMLSWKTLPCSGLRA